MRVFRTCVADELTENQLTGLAAFWGLAPLAINSMVQPVGPMTTILSTEASALLRCSPLICICDGLYVLANYIYLTLSMKSPRAAARLIACSRFSRLAREANAKPSAFENLQENTLFRIFVFVATVMTQATKLWAVSGLFWTKIWACMFVGSFITLEIIVLQLGRGWRDYKVLRQPVLRVCPTYSRSIIAAKHMQVPLNPDEPYGKTSHQHEEDPKHMVGHYSLRRILASNLFSQHVHQEQRED